MNFSEMVTQVLALTNRPDKQTQIELAINNAISEFCLRTKFFKDLVEDSIAITSTVYSQSIDLTANTTRFRSFKYVKQPGVKRYIHPLPPDKIFTPGDQMQRDRYYIIGSDLTIITSSLSATLEVGYYQYPAILSGTDTHWLTDINPFCVIDKAAARIFKDIGDRQEAATHEAYAKNSYDILVRDYADSPLSLG